MHVKSGFSLSVLTLGLLALNTGALAQSPPELKPGDMAPDWMLQGSDGRSYRLSDFKGKQAVVVAWFPKAFTGG